jgi:hypothetical protein
MKDGMIMLEEKKTAQYCHELTNLWFDRQYLSNHLASIEEDEWYVFDCGKTRWTVQESFDPRLECKNYSWSDFHEELALLFNIPIMPDTMLYTSTPVGGNPPHQDRNRRAVLNFPVNGKFGLDSPQTFFETFDRTTLKYTMPYEKSKLTDELAPWLFKGQQIHGVTNESDEGRTIITTCWRHNSYEDIKAKIEDGTLINWEQNKKNKRVRFI